MPSVLILLSRDHPYNYYQMSTAITFYEGHLMAFIFSTLFSTFVFVSLVFYVARSVDCPEKIKNSDLQISAIKSQIL